MLLVLVLLYLFGYGALIATAYALHPVVFILALIFLI